MLINNELKSINKNMILNGKVIHEEIETSSKLLKYLALFEGRSKLNIFLQKYNLYPYLYKDFYKKIILEYEVHKDYWDNYVIIGYGHHKDLIKKIIKKSIKNINISDNYIYSQAFRYTSQIQLGVNNNGWWISLYLDKNAKLVRENLLKKINNSNFNKIKFLDLLQEINKKGYEFYFYPYLYKKLNYNPNDAEMFLYNINKLKNNKITYSISIEKFHPKGIFKNSNDLCNYLEKEFIKLLPLYNFISWHPKYNNFINI